MIYNVAQLMKAPVGTVLRVDLDPADDLVLDEESVALAGEPSGGFRLHRTNQGILADGAVTAPVELICDRCLSPFTTTLTFDVREEFYPTIDVNTGLSLPPITNELIFPIDANHLLDLREAIRQQLLLALPMRTICRADCAGLCPTCGHNRNEGPCDCQPEVGDERFAVLRALLEEQAE
ncbi:MAG TPA: DUF177 domain-containing protein [Ktedonobacterales bacterium]|nr:DUF177 domain-containing protein [Ktedonobacterales bacterium]